MSVHGIRDARAGETHQEFQEYLESESLKPAERCDGIWCEMFGLVLECQCDLDGMENDNDE